MTDKFNIKKINVNQCIISSSKKYTRPQQQQQQQQHRTIRVSMNCERQTCDPAGLHRVGHMKGTRI